MFPHDKGAKAGSVALLIGEGLRGLEYEGISKRVLEICDGVDVGVASEICSVGIG